MDTNRLEAFSDGVIAVIITIMVLELKVPGGSDFKALLPMFPVFLSYVLSFIYVGLYWGNHHHLFKAWATLNGSIMWANLHLLFWLSLIPVTTAWIGNNALATAPAAIYGLVLLMAAVAWNLLQRSIVAEAGPDSAIAKATARDVKGILPMVLYFAGIILAFVAPLVSDLFYTIVAVMWLIPDRRYARASSASGEGREP